MVAARRLQEAGALGDPEEVYVSVAERVGMLASEAVRGLAATGNDAETAAEESSSFLGKYLTAVLVSFVTTLFSLTLCVVVASHYGALGGGSEPWEKWGILTGIFAIACLVYGAILSMIGTWFTKRAMVVGAGYLIGVETVLSMVPAVISNFTMSYHLRRLGELWLGWFLPDEQLEYEIVFGQAGPTWFHLVCLGVAMVAALVVGCVVVMNRQYAVGEET